MEKVKFPTTEYAWSLLWLDIVFNNERLQYIHYQAFLLLLSIVVHYAGCAAGSAVYSAVLVIMHWYRWRLSFLEIYILYTNNYLWGSLLYLPLARMHPIYICWSVGNISKIFILPKDFNKCSSMKFVI